MSSPLTEVDRELLGETLHDSEAEAITAKSNAGPGHGAQKGSDDSGFTSINATAGTLVKVSSNGDEVEARKVSEHFDDPPHTSATFYNLLSPSSLHFETLILYASPLTRCCDTFLCTSKQLILSYHALPLNFENARIPLLDA